MAEDIGDSKKKGLEGIQNLTNTKDAIESLDKDAKLSSLMSSLDSVGANVEEGEGNMRDGERTYFEDYETDEIDQDMVVTPEDIEIKKVIREGQGDMASVEKPKGLMARA